MVLAWAPVSGPAAILIFQQKVTGLMRVCDDQRLALRTLRTVVRRLCFPFLKADLGEDSKSTSWL